MTTIIDNLRLVGFDDNPDPATLGVRQHIFGELIKLAQDKIKHYHSDLYHDVHWLDKYFTEPMTFYFGVDDCGTAIGTDKDLVLRMRKWTWEISVILNHGSWWLTATEIQIPKGEEEKRRALALERHRRSIGVTK